MLRIYFRVLNLEDCSLTQKEIIERFNSIGFIQNVQIDLGSKTFGFDYGSFRDLDSAITEMDKIGFKYCYL